MKRKGDTGLDASGVKKTRVSGKGKAKLDMEPSNWPLHFQNVSMDLITAVSLNVAFLSHRTVK